MIMIDMKQRVRRRALARRVARNVIEAGCLLALVAFYGLVISEFWLGM